MHGLMQTTPLTTNMIFRRAETYWSTRRIATRTAVGIERMTVAELATEARRVAGALESLGLAADARVGSFAWNTARHLALYFAVPGTGRILHTVNIRYYPEQIVYSVNHYEELVGRSVEVDFVDSVTDEDRAGALCYTTGTSGSPKGVLYSHRSIWLHSNAGLSAFTSRITDADNVLPVVPMFHAMAWGLPYTAMSAGASITMPGPDLSPAGLLDLIASERVTYSAGVPTIWMGMLPLLGDYDVSSLQRVMCGGSAVPRSLSEGWRKAIGVPITQGWGMTETSPVASMSTLRSEFAGATADELAEVRATAGIALAGLEMRIADTDTGELLPWDDKSTGEVQVRGPWVARQYFRTDGPGEQFTEDGWLRTGDVGAISPLGYLRLVDRTKDLVKSGGEWISSVEIENLIMGHPKVAEAAVIAVPHPKWMERPLACIVVRPGEELDRDEVLSFLREHLSRWQVPDDVVFIDEIPKTSVGKFSKRTLRERFAD